MVSPGFTTLVKREVVRFLKVPNQTILPAFVSSLIFLIIFGKLIGSHLSQIQGIDYLVFIIPGLIMMAAINNAFANNSSSVFIATWLKYIEDVLITPISYLELAVAYMIGGVTRGAITSIGIMIIGAFFSLSLFAHPLLVFLMIILGSMLFALLGTIAGLWATSFEKLGIWTTFVLTPLTFFGGVFHSLSLLPPLLAKISLFNPIFYLVDGLRYAMIGISDASIMLDVIVTFACVGIALTWNVILFKRGYRLKG